MAEMSAGAIYTMVATILGEKHVTRDPSRLASYFLTTVDTAGLVAACPASTEEIQRIIRACYESRTPVFTTYDTHFPEEVGCQKGILLDFGRMNSIECVDSKNLCVHIQRGVTFEQLNEALKHLGLTALVPAAARTTSVVCHAVSRGINLSTAKYPEVQVSNMQVVLQDGEIHRTGSHANSEEMADWKEDGGPNISKWYLGSDDIFGIVVRGSIWVYPRFQGRFFDAFGFDELTKPLRLAKELPRMELTAECLVMNTTAMAGRFELSQEQLPSWTLIVGVEAFPDLADYHRRKIGEAVRGGGGSPVGSELHDVIAHGMERPWYVQPKNCTAYHTLFNRVPEFDVILSRAAESAKIQAHAIGKTYIAHGLGRAVYCQHEFSRSAPQGTFIGNLDLLLAAHGAYFDRPQGRLAEYVYGTIPSYVGHLKKIKAMMDERRIFNPGRPVREV
jgi:FAD/FMN-containing dehydrogenase